MANTVTGLHEKQQEFVDSGEDTLFLGGRRSGKTFAALSSACEYAKAGESVLYVAATAMQARESQNECMSLDNLLQGTNCKKETLTEVVLPNNGSIAFNTGHNLARGFNLNQYDWIIADEVAFYTNKGLQTVLDSRKFGAKVKAATGDTRGFPATKDMQEAGFDVILSRTLDNPEVNMDFYDDWSKTAGHIETLEGTQIGEHSFISMSTTHFSVECVKCGFRESVEDTEDPLTMAKAEGWVYGKAVNTACAGGQP